MLILWFVKNTHKFIHVYSHIQLQVLALCTFFGAFLHNLLWITNVWGVYYYNQTHGHLFASGHKLNIHVQSAPNGEPHLPPSSSSIANTVVDKANIAITQSIVGSDCSVYAFMKTFRGLSLCVNRFKKWGESKQEATGDVTSHHCVFFFFTTKNNRFTIQTETNLNKFSSRLSPKAAWMIQHDVSLRNWQKNKTDFQIFFCFGSLNAAHAGSLIGEV